jgi:hypothetical protein
MTTEFVRDAAVTGATFRFFVPLARSHDITVGAVTGAMCGGILLATAVFSLLA